MPDVPAYQPLERPTTPLAKLNAFLVDDLDPALEYIKRLHANCEDKGILFELGHRASAIRLECTRWLRVARELLAAESASQSRSVWESAEAERRESGLPASSKPPADVVKAQIKDRIRGLQATVDFLRETRDDMSDLMTFVQTGMRTMREDEFAIVDGAQSVPGLFARAGA